jgi:hypothetical protein
MKDRDFGKFLSQPGMKLALLAAACGVILYFAVGLYLDPARAQTKAAGPRTPATAPKALLNADKQKNPEDRAADQPDPAVQRAIQNELKAADDLKSRLEFTEKRLDDIQKFLAVLSTVGAIFGFAFAVFTYVNVTDQVLRGHAARPIEGRFSRHCAYERKRQASVRERWQ